MEIIPAIDIIDGKCVRLTQGDYQQKKIYNESPLEVAKQFEGIGIVRLHLVDLDGAKKGEVVNYRVLEQIASKTSLVIDFGGGIKTEKTLGYVFDSGARMAAIGSVAAREPQLFFSWLKKFGPEKILLGADVKREKIAVGGWTETTDIDVFDFVDVNRRHGVETIFCTDILHDGLLQGASVNLYESILTRFPSLKLIASGGVSCIRDLDALQKIGCSGVIIGKAIYEKRISMNEIKKYIAC